MLSVQRLSSSALTVAIVVLASCSAMTPQRNADLPYRSGTVDRSELGVMRAGRLVAPILIDNVPCAGWVRFHDDGSLASADLSRDVRITEHELPAGSRVFLAHDGQLESVWLARDTIIDGIRCKGGGKVTTSFHPGGCISEVFLSDDQEIQGVPCGASLFTPVTFDENGRLTGCRLARDWPQREQRFQRGTVMQFDPSGVASAGQ